MDVLIAKRELMIKMAFEKVTSKGYSWRATFEGWEDLTSGLVWKYEDEEGTYTYDDAMSRFGESLPSKEEWEVAEKHGVREVLSFRESYYWSSSLLSSNHYSAWVFSSDFGVVYYFLRNGAGPVRCVGR